MKEMVGGCCVCSDERGWDENPLVYCDGPGCNVAVHQACYGIVKIPQGQWYCRKCESSERTARVKCDLCPCKDGALKKTDRDGWAHVVCALYIPEVRFGNVATMEPILTSLIPPERFSKPCYICEQGDKGVKSTFGACMQCNKSGCKQTFHVTCAQMHGLLCEEAGIQDNVKYCGYCQHHYSKIVSKKNSNVKAIPPFRPVPNPAGTNRRSSSPESHASGNPVKDSVSDTPRCGPPKKKLSTSSSSSSTSSTKGSNGGGSSTSLPRIAPSSLFPSNSFSPNMNSKAGTTSDKPTDLSTSGGSSGEGQSLSTKDDAYVLKSEDAKSHSPAFSSGSPDKKYPKSSDFMTIGLEKIITGSLDRPISDHSTPSHSREKAKTPDIKPHVTLTPIRPSDKTPDITSEFVLFGQPTSHSKSKESNNEKEKHQHHHHHHDRDSSTGSSSKRSRGSVEIDSPPKLTTESHDSYKSTKTKSGEKHSKDDASKKSSAIAVTSNGPADEKIPASEQNGSTSHAKRGPGRPVKRRGSTASRSDDLSRAEDPNKKKRRGRGKNSEKNNGNGGRREEPAEPERSTTVYTIDEDATDIPTSKKRKSSSTPALPPPPPSKKPADDGTLSFAQLKAQMDAKKAAENIPGSSSVLPAHMFGNALNPASSMAQRMVDTLSQEIETIAEAGVSLETVEKPVDKLVGFPVPKFSSSNGLTNGTSPALNGVTVQLSNGATAGSSAVSGGGARAILEQLLEKQWEQGSQFLMEQAQHLDIAQLLSCLNQLKQDNRALEDHINSLLQRKDQLQALNARLSIPLSTTLSIGNGPTIPPPFSSAERSPHDLPHHSGRPNYIQNDNAPSHGSHHGPQVHGMPQAGMSNRPVNYTTNGHPVPVVVSGHNSAHNGPTGPHGHGSQSHNHGPPR